MAVYEYECEACHQRFEIQQPMRDYERLKEDYSGPQKLDRPVS